MAEEMDNIVVLTDEDGREVQFEHIVTVTHKNKEYVCLIPIEGIDYGEDEDENALIFLEIIPGKNGQDDVYQGVEDEKLLNELYAKYLEAVEFEDDEEYAKKKGCWKVFQQPLFYSAVQGSTAPAAFLPSIKSSSFSAARRPSCSLELYSEGNGSAESRA